MIIEIFKAEIFFNLPRYSLEVLKLDFESKGYFHFRKKDILENTVFGKYEIFKLTQIFNWLIEG